MSQKLPFTANAPRIGIVHEWIEPHGGAERVVKSFQETWPAAKTFTLWDNSEAQDRQGVVVESWLSQTPLRGKKAITMPIQIPIWRNIRGLGDCDKIIVSSHVFAHHARLTQNHEVSKFSYIHTPARFIWSPERDPRGKSLAAKLASSIFKPIDRHFAATSTSLAANSTFTQDAIRRFWGLESKVINPPISAAQIANAVINDSNLNADEIKILAALPSDFVLGASRFVEYKELEKVLQVALWGNLPAVIAGAGPLEKNLRYRANEMGVKAVFVISPSDRLLYQIYRKALVFVFPAFEDFGIMPLEANAAGTPVFVRNVGGTLDSLSEGVSGHGVDFLSKSDVRAALGNLTNISREDCLGHAMKFDEVVFRARVKEWIGE